MTTIQKTYSPKAADIVRNWRLINADGQTLGRLASQIAQILKGKDKPTYTPHMDTGDFVIVVNASKIRVSADKMKTKIYYSHSMYPGGLKAKTLEVMLSQHPRRVIEYAVWGMLPKNRLGRALFRKLKVYGEETHPHAAQVKELSRANKVGKPGLAKPAKRAKAAALATAQAEEKVVEEAQAVVAKKPAEASAASTEAVIDEASATEATTRARGTEKAAEDTAETAVAVEGSSEDAPTSKTPRRQASATRSRKAQSKQAKAEAATETEETKTDTTDTQAEGESGESV